MATTIETELSPELVGFAAGYLNATADAVSVTRLTGDASTRSYFRARAESSSIIIVLYSEPFDETEKAAARLERLEQINPAARLTFANDPCAHIEVTELFAGAGLPVPGILAASGKYAALLIEDVGDIKLQDWLAARTPDELVEAYRRAIRLIVKIQELTGKALSTGSICSRLAFDEMKLKWELGFFFANYFNRYLNVRLDQDTAAGVQQEFKELCSELAARTRVLAHRDYHTRNLMVSEGELFIIDHQDARMGPASYDVASLLSDPYAAIGRESAAGLLEFFVEMKAASRAPLENVQEFRHEFELMAVQRMLKAIGTYASQAAVVGNTSYVQYIDPALDSALASMNSLGRFDRTRALLEQTRR